MTTGVLNEIPQRYLKCKIDAGEEEMNEIYFYEISYVNLECY